MYNGAREEIGKYLLILPPESVVYYKKKYQNVSIFTRFSDEDIYKVVKLWENPSGSYRKREDKTLIEWLPKLHKEDKISLEKEAKAMLQNYSKDELIDIIIESEHKNKKIGVIE